MTRINQEQNNMIGALTFRRQQKRDAEEKPTVRSSVKAANDNLNHNRIERTREFWQQRIGRELSATRQNRSATTSPVFFPFWPSGRGPNCRCPPTTIPARRPPTTRARAMIAETIAKALGGRKAGSGWIARCPAHDDRNPSLSLSTGNDGKVLLRCHAGCDQVQVIDALRARGLWDQPCRHSIRRRPFKAHQQEDTPPDRSDSDRMGYALRIWRATVPASNTLAESYLQSRGLRLPSASALRFHGGLKHPSGGTWPVMVALVSRGSDDAPLAIHRTFLARDGFGKAPVDPQKLMLGPCRGGVVRLAAHSDLLMVGEGIETCLAATQVTKNPAWAALSTSGLKALDLPGDVREVIVLADGDDPGEAAARDCALRWQREGRRVRIARPPRGQDFNDMLAAQALRNREGRQ